MSAAPCGSVEVDSNETSSPGRGNVGKLKNDATGAVSERTRRTA